VRRQWYCIGQFASANGKDADKPEPGGVQGRATLLFEAMMHAMSPVDKWVLITGASSGIGLACADDLVKRGWQVVAGVRKDADRDRLLAPGHPNLRCVLLDVTNAAHIAAVADQLSQWTGARGLQGLVNNAGIVVSGPLELVSVEQLRRQYEVNVIGQHAVTQAVLPMLRRGAPSRIVMMSSISGRIALPVLGPYASSKFALEALSDALRREVRRQGIDVSVIEPGAIDTPIWGKAGDDNLAQIDESHSDVRRVYEPLITSVHQAMQESARDAKPVETVVRAVRHALEAPRPRTRDVVGRSARMMARLCRVLPDRWLDGIVRRKLGS
jgi:NAD(P)-dependent dehydrogenase (short-subunit alcohol dehydrogenase family)